jgi:hypothetical protein
MLPLQIGTEENRENYEASDLGAEHSFQDLPNTKPMLFTRPVLSERSTVG